MPGRAIERAEPVALVTGGAVRVGRLITLGLAAAGFDVVLHYHSSSDAAAEVARLVENTGRRCVLVAADLSDPAGITQVGTTVREEVGRLDVLVNSAATLEVVPLLEVDADRWDQVMAVNVRAPHLLVRELAPLLKRAGGCVVNILDLGALRPWPDYGVHSVSKGALAHLTRGQARALAPEARVNALVLGDVYPAPAPDKGRTAWVGRSSPLGRPVAEADVTQGVLFVVRAVTMTGSTIVIDGGLSL
jgi:pteridine reductase